MSARRFGAAARGTWEERVWRISNVSVAVGAYERMKESDKWEK